ncbi:UDP-N-Acetylglucosamine 2-epimerase [Pedococcus dokdonensis]|uniref:UDP-N-acetylglucosamine 2-epimerase (non-hydrolyzing) n=1 Tax=Pedococcus dokdonensis TaxID=443156 RepID=A0A1H0THA6_9MICO|nr:UDP-N-acetylglucosamine 2-epimerase (non-hydrolyzing) [Pedococcus dokdonensis]SDP53427.1 UDP-N-Acetylglucosamine 2-epimerase [Pedococcus dokdonensis]
MPHVMLIFGTRPEAIKMAPIVRAIEQSEGAVTSHVLVTAQHRHMLDQVMGILEVTADADLDLMKPSQSLAGYTALALERVTEHIAEVRPDMVLVHGDTSTAMASALGAFYNHVPVGHVEAGLRTATLNSPFPEEANRRIVTRLASTHFAPTEQARANLLAEGVSPSDVLVTGNTVIDSLHWVKNELLPRPEVAARLAERYGFLDPGKRLVLVTNHRRENFGTGMERVFTALRRLVERFPDIEIVFPVHLNPQAREPAMRLLGDLPTVHLIEPVEYVDFVHLMARAHLIITDSGGVQEEAPSLDVPVLVTRETTERPEAVEAGTALLVGVNGDLLVSEASRLLSDEAAYAHIVGLRNPYGDGLAAPRIVNHLLDPNGVTP